MSNPIHKHGRYSVAIKKQVIKEALSASPVPTDQGRELLAHLLWNSLCGTARDDGEGLKIRKLPAEIHEREFQPDIRKGDSLTP